MIKPNETFNYYTPDEVAECWDGVYSAGNLYETLWDCVKDYDKFDREDCGPHDVIGVNSVAKFWNRFTEEQQTKLNELAKQHEKELNAMIPVDEG